MLYTYSSLPNYCQQNKLCPGMLIKKNSINMGVINIAPCKPRWDMLYIIWIVTSKCNVSIYVYRLC